MVPTLTLAALLLLQPGTPPREAGSTPTRDRATPPASKGKPAPSSKPATKDEGVPDAAPDEDTARSSDRAASPVSFPHPLITEVLYAVPKGDDGDANQDGTRSATGDEFIEIVNPHDKPINLKGYVLSDGVPAKGPDSRKSDARGEAKGKGSRKGGASGAPDTATSNAEEGRTGGSSPRKAPKGSRLAFEFPDVTLQPGEVAVVFNGYEASIPGPLGDTTVAAAKNEKFAGAYVFTMRAKSQFAALANTGDCVLLSAPSGNAVECVSWGTSDKTPEVSGAIRETAPESTGSVQRRGFGPFVPHRELGRGKDANAFSPGAFEIPSRAASSEAQEPKGKSGAKGGK